MKSKISKSETKELVENFFKKLNEKSTSDEVKRIKKIVMSQNIPLKEKRKLFCKMCLVPYKYPKIRIKKGIKSVICENCGCVNRWRL